MDQLLAVHIFYSFGDLVDVQLCLGLLHSLFGLDGIEKVSSSGKLLDHYVGALGFVGIFIGGDDVGVAAEVSAVFELPLEVGSLGVGFADGFDCNYFSQDLVLSDPGGTVGTLASLLDEAVALIEV